MRTVPAGVSVESARGRHPRRQGRVVSLAEPGLDDDHHEVVTQRHVAREVAALLGYGYAGDHAGGRLLLPAYAVPLRTLLAEEADALGIRTATDLLGGVVPHPFVAGKAITHGVVSPQATVPDGWSFRLTRDLDGAVLEGYAAFSPDDARIAAEHMLERGPARLKAAAARGGHGQVVFRTREDFDAALAAITADELRRHGVVIEPDLAEARTYSIGTVHVGASCISYVGRQRTVANHHGDPAYGGSDLVVVRGGFDALASIGLSLVAAAALAKAQRYDAAVATAYPAFYASRRNYDVLHGFDADGLPRVGVLEQSWRIGGASPAELAALRAFAADRRLACVRASTHETYGGTPPPVGATVHFEDRGRRFGGLVKYVTVEADGRPA